MNVIGYRFDQLAVTEETDEKKVKSYYLNFPFQPFPVLCPKGTKLTKLVEISNSLLTFMGVEFQFLKYECPVDDRRIYFVQHPNEKDMVLKFIITIPRQVLKYVEIDHKSPELRKTSL